MSRFFRGILPWVYVIIHGSYFGWLQFPDRGSNWENSLFGFEQYMGQRGLALKEE
jgi:hypothetical protein